jgi:hypothetical protein
MVKLEDVDPTSYISGHGFALLTNVQVTASRNQIKSPD